MKIAMLNEAAPIPGRMNEDACAIFSSGDQIALLVADGAGQRMKTTQTTALFERLGTGTTSARFAAQLTRGVFEANLHRAPNEILLRANAALRQEMDSVYGELSAAALRQHEPQLAPYLDEDPRLFRMALAVCVATAVQIDRRARTLDYAHAGDTALLLFHADGRISEPTRDPVGHYDEAALKQAQQIQAEHGAPHLADVLDDPRVREANWRNGLYHNYVDGQGAVDPNLGVGVINGLPELTAYIQQDTLDLTGVEGVLVCSDGFPWPAPLDEPAEERAARLQSMRERIEHDGLEGYYVALRATERADFTRDLYPRFKIHDDCTAVYVTLSD
ncbi:MAG: protein phosphatase 2C domain-containing protein [Anaerolineae bacterium]|nr:protein phosphatase 2C domain-containing protein [Anaerolineae bacterium]